MNTSQLITRADIPNLTTMFGNIGQSWNNALPNDLFIKGVPKNIEKKFATADIKGNIGTGLDVLHTFTLPAKSLKKDGDYLEKFDGGGVAENDNQKRWLFAFGGQTYLDTGPRDIDGSAFNLQWSAESRIFRLSATSVRALGTLSVVFIHTDSAGTVVSIGGGMMIVQGNVLTVSNLDSNDTVINVQAEATANDDVTQEMSIINLTRF